MADVTRRIGLSLGADLCWPLCYEDLMRRLDLCLPLGQDQVRFRVTRVTIEPFDLAQASPYDLVIDRLTHWYTTSREWIKKAILMDGLYVFNNPWSIQSMEKQTSYCAMMDLGLPVPRTWMVPPKEYEDTPDLDTTLRHYAELFDLGHAGRELGYPLYMKPYDGGGWKGVSRIEDEQALRAAYEESGKYLMHLQEAIDPYEDFVRCVGVGPQLRMVRYDPTAPLHDRYQQDLDPVTGDDRALLEDITLTINAFFGWDFNSCESLLSKGTWHPIDFANPCPDSQVTSLHVHFPWLVLAVLRWSVFCAATRRPMHKTLDWQPFFDVRDQGLPYRERMKAYGDLARQRLAKDEFEEFCATHLSHLDEVAHEYFASDRAKEAIRGKVKALFPEHEWDEFTDLFWQRVQRWREREGPR